MATWVRTSGWRLGDGAAWAPRRQSCSRRAGATPSRGCSPAPGKGVSAVVVAGDLFADNQVDGEVVEAARELLAAAPSVSVFVVPGACDPLEAPSALRRLGAGEGRLRHVRVVDQVGVTLCGDVRLAAVPLFRRRPVGDPSAAFQETAPEGAHLLVAHGRAGEAPVRADVLHRLDVERLRSLAVPTRVWCVRPPMWWRRTRASSGGSRCGPESGLARRGVRIEGGGSRSAMAGGVSSLVATSGSRRPGRRRRRPVRHVCASQREPSRLLSPHPGGRHLGDGAY